MLKLYIRENKIEHTLHAYRNKQSTKLIAASNNNDEAILTLAMSANTLMMKPLKIILLLLITVVTTSCASKKKIVYFQGDAVLNTSYEKSVPKIGANDMLAISISAADVKATEPFNQASVYQMRNNTNEIAQNVYTVSEAGTIDFPVLGELKLSGLTRYEAIAFFKTKLNDYIVNPGVNISFTNFKISVIGEVNNPGSFTLPNERITILEALALAGDLSIQGKRNNVMVIRETNAQKTTYFIDLTSKEALNSPVYYLAQNDVVYVEPNQSKIQSSVVNYSLFISVAGIIISVIAVLSR